MPLFRLGIRHITSDEVESLGKRRSLDVQLLEYQKLLGLRLFGVCAAWLLLDLVRNLYVYGVYCLFKQLSQALNAFVTAEDIVQVKDYFFSDFVHTQVVPLAPGSIVPEVFSLGLVVV